MRCRWVLDSILRSMLTFWVPERKRSTCFVWTPDRKSLSTGRHSSLPVSMFNPMSCWKHCDREPIVHTHRLFPTTSLQSENRCMNYGIGTNRAEPASTIAQSPLWTIGCFSTREAVKGLSVRSRRPGSSMHLIRSWHPSRVDFVVLVHSRVLRFVHVFQ